MVCKDCKNGKHKKCKGGTWCDCQHRPMPQNEKVDGPETDTLASAEAIVINGLQALD